MEDRRGLQVADEPVLTDQALNKAMFVSEFSVVAGTIAGEDDAGELIEQDSVVITFLGNRPDTIGADEITVVIAQEAWEVLSNETLKAIISFALPPETDSGMAPDKGGKD